MKTLRSTYPNVIWEQLFSYLPSYPVEFLCLTIDATPGSKNLQQMISKDIFEGFSIPFKNLPKLKGLGHVIRGVALYRLKTGI